MGLFTEIALFGGSDVGDLTHYCARILVDARGGHIKIEDKHTGVLLWPQFYRKRLPDKYSLLTLAKNTVF